MSWQASRPGGRGYVNPRYQTPEHKAAREALRRVVAMGLAVCWRCTNPIPATARCGPDWQTGHDDSGTRIMGPEHTSCNRSAAARKAQRLSSASKLARTFAPRRW